MRAARMSFPASSIPTGWIGVPLDQTERAAALTWSTTILVSRTTTSQAAWGDTSTHRANSPAASLAVGQLHPGSLARHDGTRFARRRDAAVQETQGPAGDIHHVGRVRSRGQVEVDPFQGERTIAGQQRPPRRRRGREIQSGLAPRPGSQGQTLAGQGQGLGRKGAIGLQQHGVAVRRGSEGCGERWEGTLRRLHHEARRLP